MGFDISGLIIRNSFDRRIDKLSENLEIGIEQVGRCHPHEALGRIDESETVFVHFNDDSTIILYEPSRYDQKIYSQSFDSLNFQYTENAMIYALSYVRDLEVIRSLMIIDGDVLIEIGKKMKAEIDVDRPDQIVINSIEQMAGINILNIRADNSFIKCKLTSYNGVRNRKSETEIRAIVTERRISRNFTDGDNMFQ